MTLKPFGTKLDEDLIIEVKVQAALMQTTVRTIVDQALREYLTSRASEADSSRE